MPRPAFVVLGNPDNRRVVCFQDALRAQGCPPAVEVSWQAFLKSSDTLASVLTKSSVLRVESPGEDFEVERALLLRGAESAASAGSPCLPADAVRALEFERGLILNPRQWYLGFQSAAVEIESLLTERQVSALNHPADIAHMFDKVASQRMLAEMQVPVPAILGSPRSYDELISLMDEGQANHVFVKLAHGSSASGVVAVQRSGAGMRAITTAELVRDGAMTRLYNSLKLRHYTRSSEIRTVLDLLCRQHVHVEQWVPKATLGGTQFDLRVVVIGGEPMHFVVRQSRTPFTNLHLGNKRGTFTEFCAAAGDQWGEIRETCSHVMSLFPNSLYAGIDILVTPGFQSHMVLELNAFGDLLPGVEHDGNDTYSAEIAAALAAARVSPS